MARKKVPTEGMFAWTSIKTADGVIEVGSEVSAGSLGVSEDEWQQLVESRAVRSSPFPELPPNWTGSPKEYRDHLLRKQIEDLEDDFSPAEDSSEPEGNEVVEDEE
jgi:hypothetical protein